MKRIAVKICLSKGGKQYRWPEARHEGRRRFVVVPEQQKGEVASRRTRIGGGVEEGDKSNQLPKGKTLIERTVETIVEKKREERFLSGRELSVEKDKWEARQETMWVLTTHGDVHTKRKDEAV